MEGKSSSIEYSMVPHYCHSCQRRGLINTLNPVCPHCSSDFVEAVSQVRRPEPPRQTPQRHHDPFSSFPEDVFSMFNMFPSMTPRDQFFEGFRLFDRGFSRRQTSLFDRLFESSDHFSSPLFMRDFFGGPNLPGMDFESLLQHLASQQAGGPPPASQTTINALESLKIDEQLMKMCDSCAICQERFQMGETVNRLSCNHIFHPDCIVPWLKIRDTCPTCRHTVG
jgi:hypothetical protein